MVHVAFSLLFLKLTWTLQELSFNLNEYLMLFKDAMVLHSFLLVMAFIECEHCCVCYQIIELIINFILVCHWYFLMVSYHNLKRHCLGSLFVFDLYFITYVKYHQAKELDPMLPNEHKALLQVLLPVAVSFLVVFTSWMPDCLYYFNTNQF